jgi:hypothetical protein
MDIDGEYDIKQTPGKDDTKPASDKEEQTSPLP